MVLLHSGMLPAPEPGKHGNREEYYRDEEGGCGILVILIRSNPGSSHRGNAESRRPIFCGTMPLSVFYAYLGLLRFNAHETRAARHTFDKLATVRDLWDLWVDKLPYLHLDNWQPTQIPFTATPGPRRAAAELDSDLRADFLELFLTDELLQHIVDQTNLYASQYIHAHPDSLSHSRANVWKPVSVPELKAFFGLSFLTGYVKKPNIELYWSVDEVDAIPYFSRVMSRNRFQIIWRFLHYNDNESQDVTDEMYKVRPVLDYIVEKCREL
ncbi:hypothetical protein JOB18_027730 [Solea senegalensis]|uniref:PiggyBac transposable element-derived protein domain-containing protein n=1 Tax=Solea senegalensis TaxID=28829 RepID=A0AAV6SZY6_SOLSE|nr:hypothetical protein JOB18_027730 [Solea senegalensis]